jgi:hypothetical protein
METNSQGHVFIISYQYQVIMEAVNKPRNIQYKGVADLVTE